MAHLSIRLPESTLRRFDALTAHRGLTRARLLRQLINGVLDGAPVGATDIPSQDELLSEKARQGNVAAIGGRRERFASPDEAEALIAAVPELDRAI